MREIRKLEPALPVLPVRKRVAGYARVSCEKEAMLHSLSAQVSYYSELIQRRRDWEYVGVYADEAVTGTKIARPEFQRLMNDCRNGKIDMIVTKSVTRFARNTVLMLETVRELKALNVDVWFEKENIHSLSGDGELMLTILSSFAQEESRSVSENCKWRIRKDFKEGRPVTVQMYGYRIRKGKFYVVPEEAAVVRRIFVMCLEGYGRNIITRTLNEENIPARYKGKWHDSTIGEILANEKYVGDLLMQKTFVADHIGKVQKRNKGELAQYFIADNHEAIVTREVFDRVQAVVEARARQFRVSDAPMKKYPFTGIIRCGNCGQHFKRKVAYGKGAWNCSVYLKHGKNACHAKQIPEETLTALAAQALGLATFDEAVFEKRVAEVLMPGNNRVVFTFRDGRVVEKVWQDRSRRDSWSDEMRQVARERQNEVLKKRGKNDE